MLRKKVNSMGRLLCQTCGEPIFSHYDMREIDSGWHHKTCLMQKRIDDLEGKFEPGYKQAVSVNDKALP